MQLKVLHGSYQFDLPMAFYPDYPLDFKYEVRLQTKNPISSLSLPQHAEITAQNDT